MLRGKEQGVVKHIWVLVSLSLCPGIWRIQGQHIHPRVARSGVGQCPPSPSHLPRDRAVGLDLGQPPPPGGSAPGPLCHVNRRIGMSGMELVPHVSSTEGGVLSFSLRPQEPGSCQAPGLSAPSTTQGRMHLWDPPSYWHFLRTS